MKKSEKLRKALELLEQAEIIVEKELGRMPGIETRYAIEDAMMQLMMDILEAESEED